MKEKKKKSIGNVILLLAVGCMCMAMYYLFKTVA